MRRDQSAFQDRQNRIISIAGRSARDELDYTAYQVGLHLKEMYEASYEKERLLAYSYLLDDVVECFLFITAGITGPPLQDITRLFGPCIDAGLDRDVKDVSFNSETRFNSPILVVLSQTYAMDATMKVAYDEAKRLLINASVPLYFALKPLKSGEHYRQKIRL